jgi:protoporphyrinogen oxidase
VTSQHHDVIILGAGVTGLTAAHALLPSALRVAVIEDYPGAGGNHLSKDMGGCSFDVGAIFFWSDSPLLGLFPGIEAHWTPVNYSIARVTPQGNVRAYPFDMREEFFGRPLPYQLAVIADVLVHKLFWRRKASAADFARAHIGGKLFRDSGLSGYMRRFYGFSAEEISYPFALRRMKWIAQNASLAPRVARFVRSAGRRLGLVAHPAPLRCFARSRDGFQAMYGHALASLQALGADAVLNAGTSSVRKTAEGFEVHTEAGTFTAPRLINTLPLVKVARLLGMDAAEAPESTAMITACFRFRGQRHFAALILHNFAADGLWKRLTMHSDYYGRADGWEFFSVEVSVRGTLPGIDTLVADFRATTAQAGLFEGELECLGSFVTDFAYPVYDQSAEARKTTLVQALSDMGIESLGRQGNFDYIPSATVAIAQAQAYLLESPPPRCARPP